MFIPRIIVTETFSSIQGESTYAGCLCFFIRLAGCNLNCNYCDTLYSRKTEQGKSTDIPLLVEAALEENINLVEITGGEPLFQKTTPLLCAELLRNNFTVLVETNGSLPISLLPENVIKIMDCKTPSGGEASRMDFSNFDLLNPLDEIKFVIADRTDYSYSLDIIEKYKLDGKTPNLLFSPGWGKIESAELAGWIIKDKAPVRLQLQLHKYIWGPEKRGV